MSNAFNLTKPKQNAKVPYPTALAPHRQNFIGQKSFIDAVKGNQIGPDGNARQELEKKRKGNSYTTIGSVPFSSIKDLRPDTNITHKDKVIIPFRVFGFSRFLVPRPEVKSNDELLLLAQDAASTDLENTEKLLKYHDKLTRIINGLNELNEFNTQQKEEEDICSLAGFLKGDCITCLLNDDTESVNNNLPLQVMLSSRYNFNCELPAFELDKIVKHAIPATLLQLFRIWFAGTMLQKDKSNKHFKDLEEFSDVFNYEKGLFDLTNENKAFNLEIQIDLDALLQYFCICPEVVKYIQTQCANGIDTDHNDKKYMTINYFVGLTKAEKDSKGRTDHCRIHIMHLQDQHNFATLYDRLAVVSQDVSSRKMFDYELKSKFFEYFFDYAKYDECDIEGASIDLSSFLLTRKRPIFVGSNHEPDYINPTINEKDLTTISEMDVLDESLTGLREAVVTLITGSYTKEQITEMALNENSSKITPDFESEFNLCWNSSMFGSQETDGFPLPKSLRIALGKLSTREKLKFIACLFLPADQIRGTYVPLFASGILPSSTSLPQTPSLTAGKRKKCPDRALIDKSQYEFRLNTCVMGFRSLIIMCCVSHQLGIIKENTIETWKNSETACSDDEQSQQLWSILVGLVRDFTSITHASTQNIDSIRDGLLDFDRIVMNRVSYFLNLELKADENGVVYTESDDSTNNSSSDVIDVDDEQSLKVVEYRAPTGITKAPKQLNHCATLLICIFNIVRLKIIRMTYQNTESGKKTFQSDVANLLETQTKKFKTRQAAMDTALHTKDGVENSANKYTDSYKPKGLFDRGSYIPSISHQSQSTVITNADGTSGITNNKTLSTIDKTIQNLTPKEVTKLITKLANVCKKLSLSQIDVLFSNETIFSPQTFTGLALDDLAECLKALGHINVKKAGVEPNLFVQTSGIFMNKFASLKTALQNTSLVSLNGSVVKFKDYIEKGSDVLQTQQYHGLSLPPAYIFAEGFHIIEITTGQNVYIGYMSTTIAAKFNKSPNPSSKIYKCMINKITHNLSLPNKVSRGNISCTDAFGSNADAFTTVAETCLPPIFNDAQFVNDIYEKTSSANLSLDIFKFYFPHLHEDIITECQKNSVNLNAQKMQDKIVYALKQLVLKIDNNNTDPAILVRANHVVSLLLIALGLQHVPVNTQTSDAFAMNNDTHGLGFGLFCINLVKDLFYRHGTNKFIYVSLVKSEEGITINTKITSFSQVLQYLTITPFLIVEFDWSAIAKTIGTFDTSKYTAKRSDKYMMKPINGTSAVVLPTTKFAANDTQTLDNLRSKHIDSSRFDGTNNPTTKQEIQTQLLMIDLVPASQKLTFIHSI